MMAAAGSPFRVLVVDDHDIVRLGVRHLLGARAEVFEAASLPQAREWLTEHRCELLLFDLGLGNDFGLAALPRLRSDWPAMKILVLTSMAEDLFAERALHAGADGFVMKSALAQTLLEAVDTVLAGGVYASPRVSAGLLRRAAGRDAPEGRPALSNRELEVLRGIAAGQSTRDIAEALNRSVKTIETHKQALKTKLGAETPAQLLRLAVAWFADAA
jgi:two-component system, NarL family, response regulator FusR